MDPAFLEMERLISRKFPEEAQEIREEVQAMKLKKSAKLKNRFKRSAPKTMGGRMMASVSSKRGQAKVAKKIKKKSPKKQRSVKKKRKLRSSSSKKSKKKIKLRNKA